MIRFALEEGVWDSRLSSTLWFEIIAFTLEEVFFTTRLWRDLIWGHSPSFLLKLSHRMSTNKGFVRLESVYIYIERDCYEGKSSWVWFQFPVLLICFVLKPPWLGNPCVVPESRIGRILFNSEARGMFSNIGSRQSQFACFVPSALSAVLAHFG